MRVLFDTDVLSHTMKPYPPQGLLQRVALVPPEDQFISSITVGEMVYGAYRSQRPGYFLEKLDAVLSNLEALSFDGKAARTYGRLRAQLEQAGTPVSEPDLRIASIALTHDLTLVTGNVRHFERIPGLRVENWLAGQVEGTSDPGATGP